MSQRSSDPELRYIEAALGELVPVSSQLDRDALTFQAGAALSRSASWGRCAWTAITALLVVAMILESLMLAVGPGPRVVEKTVGIRDRAAATSTPSTLDAVVKRPPQANSLSEAGSLEVATLAASWPVTSENQRIQELVLRLGLDALHRRSSKTVSASDSTADRLHGAAPSAGRLRRLELERLVNRSPGDP
jgi:hypothetical protein